MYTLTTLQPKCPNYVEIINIFSLVPNCSIFRVIKINFKSCMHTYMHDIILQYQGHQVAYQPTMPDSEISSLKDELHHQQGPCILEDSSPLPTHSAVTE